MAIPARMELSVAFLREGKAFIAYSPALDLSTSGKTLSDAKKRFQEAVSIFFEELNKKGTTEDVLTNLGWIKERKRYVPPTIIGHGTQEIKVPVYA